MIPLVGISYWLIIKIFVLLALLFYLLFSVFLVRQVMMMSKTIQVGLEGVLTTIAYLHLGITILVLVLALVVL